MQLLAIGRDTRELECKSNFCSRFLFHSFNIMRDRSGRVRAPWSSIGHVPEFLSSSEEQQHQLDALVAGLDRETLQKTDEPLELQSGESTTHGKAFPAIDDVSSSLLFLLLPDAVMPLPTLQPLTDVRD